MAIDTSLIQDTDWLACTDGGITYKVSGAEFKKLLKEPTTYEFTINTTNRELNLKTQQDIDEYVGQSFTIDWGDGSTETLVQPTTINHRWSANGEWNIKITVNKGGPFSLFGAFAGDQAKWVSIDNTSSEFNWGPTLEKSWYGCNQLTSFPLIDIASNSGLSLNYAWNGCSGLTSFPDLDYSSVERMSYAWQNCTELVTWNSNATVNLPECVSLGAAWWGCSKLTSIPSLNIPKATSLWYAFYSCQALTLIPLMDTSNITLWDGTFNNCQNLETIPALDFSSATSVTNTFTSCGVKTFDGPLEFGNVTTFENLFIRCEELLALPYIDTSSGINFKEMFHFCRKITTIPASLDFSKGTNFNETFADCNALTDFPPNMFDVTGTLLGNSFSRAFAGCSLTPISVENVLVSLDTNGQSNITLSLDGPNNSPKSTWTAAANTAYDNLIAKGWTILHS
tara:strand:+ start:2126 stop:3484 length:1359 start_codon:yes stop_codon:yes gene_type:complete